MIHRRRGCVAAATALLAVGLAGVGAVPALAAPVERRFELGTPAGDVTLDFSSFVGGAEADEGLAIAVDRRGDTYVAGRTSSPDFPTTPEAFDTTLNGDADAFVAKVGRDGQLKYATVLGAASFDDANSIAVDRHGNAYVRGVTRSPDFAVTAGAFDTTFNGGFDVYVAKLSADGSRLAYSTFIGGAGFRFRF